MLERLPYDPLPCVAARFAFVESRRAIRKRLPRRVVADFQMAALQPPDSQLAKRATELASDAYDAHLMGHSWRTWAFATAVGTVLGLRFDSEVLFVSCLLHDLGFTETHRNHQPFELSGAKAAYKCCLPDTRRGALVHDAIAMHTSIRAAFGPSEQRLVQTGSGADLMGLDAELLRHSTVGAIQNRWPITPGLAAAVDKNLREATQPHPTSPGAQLVRLKFGWHMKRYLGA